MDDEDTIVWRLEFSIKSEAKKWVEVSDESTDNPQASNDKRLIAMITEISYLLFINLWHNAYFHFKVIEFKNGKKTSQR